jgi:hypothetical protein
MVTCKPGFGKREHALVFTFKRAARLPRFRRLPPIAHGFYAGLKRSDLADISAYLRNVTPLQ